MSLALGHQRRYPKATPRAALGVSPLYLDPSLLLSLGPTGFQCWFLPLLPPHLPGPETFNTTGIIVTRNGSLVSAIFDGTVTISVIALSNILHASCGLPEEYRNRTEGLLGEKQAGF